MKQNEPSSGIVAAHATHLMSPPLYNDEDYR